MSLPLWKAKRIVEAGGFKAALTKEAEKVVKAAETVKEVAEAPAPPEPPELPAEVDEDVKLPDVP